MKHLFKSLIAGFMLFVAPVKADVAIFNPTDTSATSILQNGSSIQQISFANAAVAAINITLYDAPTNVLTYTVGAYTNNVYSLANVVTTFTNITGVIQSSTNRTLQITPTAVAASTNNYKTFYSITIPASSTISWTPPQAQTVGFGLAGVASATNVIATVIYLPTR